MAGPAAWARRWRAHRRAAAVALRALAARWMPAAVGRVSPLCWAAGRQLRHHEGDWCAAWLSGPPGSARAVAALLAAAFQDVWQTREAEVQPRVAVALAATVAAAAALLAEAAWCMASQPAAMPRAVWSSLRQIRMCWPEGLQVGELCSAERPANNHVHFAALNMKPRGTPAY